MKVDQKSIDQIEIDQINFDEKTRQDWQALAEKSWADPALADIANVSASGLSIDALYTQRPLANDSLKADPLQRWDNRLAVIGINEQEQNANVLAGLQGGVDSLQMTLSSPEQSAPVTPEKLHAVLDTVQLELISISLFAGSQFLNAAAALESLWSKQGVSSDKALASFNADPIGTLASTGCLAVELDTLLKELATLASNTHTSLPRVNSVCVNGACYHNAGATIEQELVSIVATGALYLQTLLDAGMSEQAATNTIVFQVACDADLLANVVKLRVLKQLWHHVAEQMGAKNPQCHIVVETSARMQSRLSPWVNHLRNVSAASAAAMGGARSIVVHPHNYIDNKFIDDQTELSARVARNIPIMLSEEAAIDFVHDPMAGSYAIETLSANLIDSSWMSLQTLETEGGLVKALSTGRWQAAIGEARQVRINRMQQEKDIKVGVNRYTSTTGNSAHATSEATEVASNTQHKNRSSAGVNTQCDWAMNVDAMQVQRDAMEFED